MRVCELDPPRSYDLTIVACWIGDDPEVAPDRLDPVESLRAVDIRHHASAVRSPMPGIIVRNWTPGWAAPVRSLHAVKHARQRHQRLLEYVALPRVHRRGQLHPGKPSQPTS